MSQREVGKLYDLPPLSALFLTHFDDIKGQSVIYYKSSFPNLSSDNIEHSSLPSGLHTTSEDVVFFSHHNLPSVGLFRSRDTSSVSGQVGRGRRMATLGVVLCQFTPEDTFSLPETLQKIYDHLESEDFLQNAPKILDEIWDSLPSSSTTPDLGQSPSWEIAGNEAVERKGASARHPVAYMSAVVASLGPSVITVYKAALAGRRILLYSPPPLLPLSAFAWCIWAMSLPPPQAEVKSSTWIGHIGLMDLTSVTSRKDGWIATTSDAIYRSHPNSYDLFLDLSPLHLRPVIPSLSPPFLTDEETFSDPRIFSSLTSPNIPTEITYSFSDVPLYKSLLSPPGLSQNLTTALDVGVNKRRWWLVFYDVVSGLWTVCRGVCDYALALNLVRPVRLDEGEEDAQEIGENVPLLRNDPTHIDSDEVGGDEGVEGVGDGDGEEEMEEMMEEEESVKVGRHMLRVLFHNTHHLYEQLRIVASRSPGRGLGEEEIKSLSGRWARADDKAWWMALSITWGFDQPS
ncbi:hypothetical protein TREMEDRAFT_25151 [Tremella mesenterica DSM 1558]|uniref:uncharacterized protein n=1 Tax=Tremella mesenterica (strain ATCC 24925 / CBS 8224 / DSM 1558 / NBRC 9311 / NRRL Y-6157 / RJB 2259-6 / UBC 559-6) TaxID=578456 RepID=UPI0003F4937F|nr:uncharacterized protein TREMEDRAFT_25151 [Tremella mesenterica DSM 1558]EIW72588.1 hypothetical protein TREMEDRAFT_25151 [Tremella mesenterica DSM 1558]